uniref:NADH:ubiquinone oxidoreductase intermediate-associated protein 30 domain-containing protein n=1 Tax=Corethron hystrix TaxID=216773 RepID=A0A7S1BXL5_9STRA|mmetsp:Transcript_42673/g.100111  ORF Transcript_42673/g.100111 Transcript_42673/m.100111 type:complete len:408 (+) Transcript_42673:146-1369(+)
MPSSFFRRTFLVLLSCPALSAASADYLDGGPSGWDESSWRVQTDNVMGGRSTASVSFSDGALVFAGNINLNGGGFANVRKNVSLDLTGRAGIVVEMEADALEGKAPLAMNLQLSDGRCSFSAAFAVPLATREGVVARAFLPTAAFDKRGYGNWWCDRLKLSSVRAVRFYVLYQGGPFVARIRSVSIVDRPPSIAPPAIAFTSWGEAEALLSSTIQAGVFMWNKGYRDLCIAVYRSVLESLAAAAGFEVSCSGVTKFPAHAVGNSAEQTVGMGLRLVIDDVRDALAEKKPAADELGAALDAAMGCCADEMKKCVRLAKKGRCGGWIPVKKNGALVEKWRTENHCPKSCDSCAERCADDAAFRIVKTVGGKSKKFRCAQIPNAHVRCTDMAPKKRRVREFCRASCKFCG